MYSLKSLDYYKMLYAYKNNQKIEAAPGEKALCPECGGVVIAKCGSINIWHWAHEQNSNCDHWSEPETEWHLSWKKCWPSQCVEVVIEKRGVKHRADILTPDGTVIELQHSSLSVEEINEREVFYGKMIWLFDVVEPYEMGSLKFREKENYWTFRWKHPRKHLAFTNKDSYWDWDSGTLFYLKTMYAEPPCRGWGQFAKTKWFIKNFGGRIG
jgi:competence protein CoiA